MKIGEKIECPVSAGVLRGLYWDKVMSFNSIAKHLFDTGLIEKVVSEGVVRRWFTELGVEKANHKQGGRRSAIAKRRIYGSVGATLRGRSWSLSESQKKKQSQILKGKKLGNQTPEQLGYPVLRCACCDEFFHRCCANIRQSFRHGRKFVYFYCSRKCHHGGPRFSDPIEADAVYFKTEWYISALDKAGIPESQRGGL